MCKTRRDHRKRVPGTRVIGVFIVGVGGYVDLVQPVLFMQFIEYVSARVLRVQPCKRLHFIRHLQHGLGRIRRRIDIEQYVEARRNRLRACNPGQEHFRKAPPGFPAKRAKGYPVFLPGVELVHKYGKAKNTGEDGQNREPGQGKVWLNRNKQ